MSAAVTRTSSAELHGRPAYFYLPERRALGSIDPLSLDPDRDWAIFGTGVYVWILQTFLRLRQAGAPVHLVDHPPAAGLIVTHADHFCRLLAGAPSARDLTIVVVRSDRSPQPLADFGIVQNGADTDDYHFFIPSWLQPGLRPRLVERGTRIETAAYFGSIAELAPELGRPEWADVLHARGINWDTRTIAFAGNDHLYDRVRWNDYTTIDVVVALRPATSWNTRSKPASKLQNAWAAGVPAILNPESAYRQLRQSSLDYIEARSGNDVLAALDTLRSNPGLYAAMVENGRQRAQEIGPDRITTRWVEVLWHQIPDRAGRPTQRLLARSRRCRALVRRLNRRLSTRSEVTAP